MTDPKILAQTAAAPATPPPMPPQTGVAPQGGAGGQKLIIELKVSGHLMTFDAGLFCIFSAPGSAAPDAGTGLPGVRLSLPPGPAFHPEAVTISTFRDDGWLGGWNGAALVRVARGPAQVMVTIYQAPNSAAEAPRLQIMRLQDGNAPQQAGQAAAPAQGPAPTQVAAGAPPALRPQGSTQVTAPAAQIQAAPAAPAASLPQNTPAGGGAKPSGEAASQAEMVAHIQGRGDVLARLGEWMGVGGSKQWVEGFALSPKQTIGPGDIEYQAVLGRGWLSPWAEGGQFCGSRSMSLPILGLRVRLRGQAAEDFDCALTATFVDGSQAGPLDNGEPCQAESLAPLEAFRIEIRPRDGAADEAVGTPAAKRGAKAKPTAPPAPAAAPPKPASALPPRVMAPPPSAKPPLTKSPPTKAPLPKPTTRRKT